MTAALLSLAGAGVNLGDRWLFRHADVTVSAGDRLCLVGRNGAGKSTLMKLMAGLAEADEGELWTAPGAGVAYLPQAPELPGGTTLAGIVMKGSGGDGGYAAEQHRAEAMLTRFGMDPAMLADGLSGGEARRVALARALVNEPDLMLMDEPTNHLDLPTIAWMEEMLLSRGGALVVVSHDRAFLRRVGNATLWLDGGALRRRQGGFDGFDEWADGIQREEAVRLHKMDRRIAEETSWSREGIAARRRRNQGRLRELAKMRAERARMAAPLGKSARIEAAAAGGGGQMVLEAVDLTVSVPGRAQGSGAGGERRVLVDHFNAVVRRSDRIGIIGRNGAGKSTLVKALLGHIAPDSGRVRQGFGLMGAYFDQERAALDGEDSPWTVLCPGGGDSVEVAGRRIHVKRYLRDFLFDDRKATQKVRSLSGGEQNRLLLAKLFAGEHNFLVMDEPTNDLDMETLELLQEVLAEYKGTVVVISHDRDFIDRTVTALLVFEDDGGIVPHSGGYSDYLARRVRGEARKRSRPQGAGAGPKPKPVRGAKLSFRDKHALEVLPGEISGLEEAISRAEAALADPGLFTRERDRFDRLARQLADDRASLAGKEEQWLELEMRRQEIEKGQG